MYQKRDRDMLNLKIGFWITLISAMLSAWLLVGSPLMIYSVMMSMTFLVGIFVLRDVQQMMSAAITTALVLDKADVVEKIKEGLDE